MCDRARNPISAIVLIVAAFCVRPVSAVDMHGKFLGHIIEANFSNGHRGPITQSDNGLFSTLSLPFTWPAAGNITVGEVTVTIQTPSMTPTGTLNGAFTNPLTDITWHTPVTISAECQARLTIGSQAGAEISAEVRANVGDFNFPFQDSTVGPGSHTFSAGGAAPQPATNGLYQPTKNSRHTGMPANARFPWVSHFQIILRPPTGAARALHVWIYSYYEFTEGPAPVDELTVLGHEPEDPSVTATLIQTGYPPAVQEFILETGGQIVFGARVRYWLRTDSEGLLRLEIKDAKGNRVAGNSFDVTRSDRPQVKWLIAPVRPLPEMQTLRVTMTLLNSNFDTLLERTVATYPVHDFPDRLWLKEPFPFGLHFLVEGEPVGFGAKLVYELHSRETAQLVLEVVSANGTVLASDSIPVTRGLPPGTTGAEKSAVLSAGATASAGIFMRVRLMDGTTVLVEQKETFVVAKKATFRVVSVTGEVEFEQRSESRTVSVGMEFDGRIVIRTGLDSTVELLATITDPNGQTEERRLTVQELTEIELETLVDVGAAVLWRAKLIHGEFLLREMHDRPSSFDVKTPTATAGVRGSAIRVRHVEEPEPLSTFEVTEGSLFVDPANALLSDAMLMPGGIAQVTATKLTSPTAPVITGVSPGTGTSGSTLITITGTGFDSMAVPRIVTVGGVMATFVSSTSTELRVTLPPGLPTATLPLVVTVNGFSSNALDVNVVAATAPTAVSGDVSGTWTRALSPYQVNGSVTVSAGQTLTIEPGVVVLFASAASALDVRGALISNGTLEAPVLFTSSNAIKAPGQWGGIRFHDSSDDATTRLRYSTVEAAGAAPFAAALMIADASPALEFCTVRTTMGHGLHLTRARPKLNGCFLTTCSGSALWIEENSFPVLSGNLAAANGRDVISVAGHTITQDGGWENDGLPILLHGDITVAAEKFFALEAGARIELLAPDTDLIVNGVLLARGTAEEPIVFTSDESVKAPGQWGAVVLQNAAIPTLLESCIFGHGGGSRNGMLELSGAAHVVANSLLFRSAGDGIFASQADARVLNSRVFDHNRDGIRVAAGAATASFAVHQCALSGNTGFAVNNLTTQTIAAQNNYWGDTSGPKDNSNADGAGRLNPASPGDDVSEFVDWSSFLTRDPAVTSPPLPDLDFQISLTPGGEILLSWRDAQLPSLVLQQSSNLGALLNWSPLAFTGTPAGGRIHVTLPRTSPQKFFRLTSGP